MVLRAFYLDKAPVEISEFSLYEELYNYGYYTQLLAWFFIISSFTLMLLASYKQKFFYFLLLSLITFTVYIPAKLPANAQGSDSMWYMPQVLSLITEQNIDLDEYPERIKAVNNYAIMKIGNASLNYFPYGTVLVNYPLTLLTKHFFNCNLSTEATKIDCGLNVAELNAKILASLSVGFMFLTVLSLTNSLNASFLLALIFAFASPHFSNHAGGIWSHNTTTFLITTALFMMLRSSSHTYLAAIPLFLSYVTRPSMSISVAILSTYYIFSNRKNFNTIIKYLIFLGLMFFIFLIINIFIYENTLPPYYFASRLNSTTFKEAIVGIFISPNRGLFIFFPIALFSFFGIYLTFKEQFTQPIFDNNKLLFTSLSLLILLNSFAYSLFPHWWMGHSYGPRMFAEIIPYFIILMIPTIQYIRSIHIVKFIFAIFLLFSMYVQLIGVFDIKSHHWNGSVDVDRNPSKLWDWSDMQMFRWLHQQQ